MKRFKHILFVADRRGDAGPAFDRALALARGNDARLTVLDVVEPMLPVESDAAGARVDMQALAVDQRRDELDAMVVRHASTGPAVEVRVASGTPFLEVIRAVQRQGHDLVIKAAQRPRSALDRLFGSTDMHLLRKCPCPVWIDHPDGGRPYRRILAAVDPLAEVGPAMGRLILELAGSLAEREGAELHVVHAWRLPGESLLRNGRARLPEHEVDTLVAGAREEHRSALEALLRHLPTEAQDRRVHLEKGHPAAVITDCSRRLGADLVVMGTVGRTGVAGLFMGNTAEDVLHASATAVLAVKPEGFVSPVTAHG